MSLVPPPPATTGDPRAVAGLPDPGERVPRLAWPTVGLFVAALALFAGEVVAHLAGVPAWVTVPMGAVVTFVMFSVMHESTHHAVSTRTGLNDAFGRAATPFVAPYAAFSMLRFIHIEHHRNTNEARDTDPDAWTSEGPWWQLPLRWATIDVWYVVFYGRRFVSRPRAEQAGAVATVAVFAAGVVALVASGHGTTLVVLVLLPQRLGLTVLAWWFDYLPHHGLTVTQRQDKYRATRVRVGGERMLTPLFVYQNYHLVHHLHPSIPFYRYVRAWRRNESAYLDRDAAISTWFGRSLSAEEYRTWRRLTDPVEAARSGSGTRPVFHPLRVRSVEALTDDSVRLTFEVPDDLVEAYRFTAGAHLTLRGRIDGADVRRTYSVCSSEQSGLLQVAVRRHPGGVFSTYATTVLAAGDVLDVMTPAGDFGATTPASPVEAGRHLVAVAAGSGITPVLSVVATELERDPEARVTLVAINRSASTEMLADDLADLERRHGDRLHLVRHLTGGTGSSPQARGARPEAADLTAVADAPTEVSCWYLCGPRSLVQSLAAHLENAGVPAERVRTELFTGGPVTATERPADVAGRDTEVRVTLDGLDHTLRFHTAGPTLLEAALDAGVELPYSCAGGACGTCRGRILQGAAQMDQNHVLTPAQVEAGEVLACQARPTTEQVHVTFDAGPLPPRPR